MAMRVSNCLNVREETAAADYPKVRVFTVANRAAEAPAGDLRGRWTVCSPQQVGSFSAVGYFFARDLHKTLDVPVGIIVSAWGGTPAEAWTSQPTLEADPEFRSILESWTRRLADYPALKAGYDEAMAQWKEKAAQAQEAGRQAPRAPSAPTGPDSPFRPANLYNGMIAPLVPYAIRGATWYQGEANTDRAQQYRKLLPAMITNWRTLWGEGDFPFLIVQLANFQRTADRPADSGWARLREAQLMTLKLPNTGLAVAIDVGEADNIHPKNKQEVGRRLALWALANTYGRKLVYSGPLYASMKVEGNAVRIRFSQVGGGLAAKDSEPLKGFAIAGADRKFVWADARIDNGMVVISSPDVANPLAVRYAWADNPVCNLCNKEGLPASPFRTDDW